MTKKDKFAKILEHPRMKAKVKLTKIFTALMNI
jgi:hypothetical protein